MEDELGMGRTRWLRYPLPASRWGRFAAAAVPVLLFVLVWQFAFTVWFDRPRLFPPPTLVLEDISRIVSGDSVVGSSHAHATATLMRLVVAFGISFVLGSALGILAGRMKVFFDLLDNLVWTFMAVPSVVWAFIFVVALGIRDLVPIAALSALLTPVVLVNVAEGSKSIPKDLLEMADSYKAGLQQRVREVFLPYLVPYLASSARVTFALGLKIVVIAEVIGLRSGIGYELNYWYTQLFLGPIVAWGVLMIVVGLLVDYGVFGPLERRASRWRGADTGAVRSRAVG